MSTTTQPRQILEVSLVVCAHGGRPEKDSTTYASSAAGAAALLLEHLEANGWKVDDYEVATQGTSAGSINRQLSACYYYSFDAMGDKERPRVMVHVTRVDATPERLAEVKKNKEWAASGLKPAPYVAPAAAEAAPGLPDAADVATSATIRDTRGAYAKHNGRTYRIAQHLATGVALELEGRTVDFHLSEVELHGARPASFLEQPAPVGEEPLRAPGPGGEPCPLAELEENAGYVSATPTAAPAGWVTVYLAAAQGLDVGGLPFAVSCEGHGNLTGAATLERAGELQARPALFCPDCCAVVGEEALPYQVILTTLEPGSKSSGQRRPLYESESHEQAQEVFLALVHGAEGRGVPASGHEAGDGALEAPVQLLELLHQGRLTRRWYFGELLEPGAFLYYEGPDFVLSTSQYVAWAYDELEEADVWAQVREWERGGTHLDYAAACRAKFGEEAEQLPWQWQAEQDLREQERRGW